MYDILESHRQKEPRMYKITATTAELAAEEAPQ